MYFLTTRDLMREMRVQYDYVKNLNFVLPIGYALKIADEIIDKGMVSRSYLGLEFQITADDEGNMKALVSYVEPGGPAEKAGIKPGDILEKIGAFPVKANVKDDLPKIRRTIAELPVGSNVTLQLDRNGKMVSVSAVPAVDTLAEDFEFFCEIWGLSLKPLNERETRKRGLKEGKGFFISYIDPNGRAKEAGLSVGDTVISIENEIPETKEALSQLYKKLSGDSSLSSVFFYVLRSGFKRFFLVSNIRKVSTTNNR